MPLLRSEFRVHKPQGLQCDRVPGPLGAMGSFLASSSSWRRLLLRPPPEPRFFFIFWFFQRALLPVGTGPGGSPRRPHPQCPLPGGTWSCGFWCPGWGCLVGWALPSGGCPECVSACVEPVAAVCRAQGWRAGSAPALAFHGGLGAWEGGTQTSCCPPGGLLPGAHSPGSLGLPAGHEAGSGVSGSQVTVLLWWSDSDCLKQ